VNVVASLRVYAKAQLVDGIINLTALVLGLRKMIGDNVLASGIMSITIVMPGIGVLTRVWEMWLGLAEGQ